MGKNITVIPASMPMEPRHIVIPEKRIRMAAYCRVSTEQDEQLSSYENQVTYYTKYINNDPHYAFAGIYADEGITGTSTKNRDGFKRMIEDCKAGKIDRIIVKSISRFARNTLDCLNYVRELKGIGVGVFFEKENIFTLDAKGEVLLTILSSLAQDESRSISENSQWGIRKRFEQGHVRVNTTHFLGYDKGPDGKLVINEKEAEAVRMVFDLYLEGLNTDCICRELNRRKIAGLHQKIKWIATTVETMLCNEKYKGDALLQKTFTVDFLTKKRIKNTGQLPQYYVKGCIPPIVDPEIWEAVQLERIRRHKFMKDHKAKVFGQRCLDNALSGRVVCGECGEMFGRKQWRVSKEKGYVVVWQCNAIYKIKGVIGCYNRHVRETTLKEGFIKAWHKLMRNKGALTRKWQVFSHDKNALIAYRAKTMLELSSKIIPDVFDNFWFLRTIESITVFADGRLVYRFLDGSETTLGAGS